MVSLKEEKDFFIKPGGWAGGHLMLDAYIFWHARKFLQIFAQPRPLLVSLALLNTSH